MYRILVIGALLLTTTLSAQNVRFDYTNNTYVDHIKTVIFGPTGYPHFFPLIILGEGQTLTLSFDDLEFDVRNYTYSVIHCDRDWQPSGLAPLEYINGFQEENIPFYDFSQRIRLILHCSSFLICSFVVA